MPGAATLVKGELALALHRLTRAGRWGVTVELFGDALARSAERALAGSADDARGVERYLRGLQLEDLALACACAAGSDEAWDHFVQEYRPILYRAADALDPSGGGREVADSLHAELFGLRDRGGERQSLFSHFHGRSSLATWLRAVLAQRFVDRARSRRRLDPLLARHARAHRADDRWWDGVGFAPDYDSRTPHDRRVRFERCLLDSRAGRHGFSHGGWSDVDANDLTGSGRHPLDRPHRRVQRRRHDGGRPFLRHRRRRPDLVPAARARTCRGSVLRPDAPSHPVHESRTEGQDIRRSRSGIREGLPIS
ncbi:MAG: hypothetical protein H0X67_13230 [Acidobacteria bacterium]|nr:hypothetical protein [Acidobacteriota bacterium]